MKDTIIKYCNGIYTYTYIYFFSRLRLSAYLLLFFLVGLSSNKPLLAQDLNQLGTLNQPIVFAFLSNQASKKSSNEAQYYKRLLAAITARYGIYFVVQQSESYEEAVSDFCQGKTHITILGAVTYNQAKQRCHFTEFLAAEVRNGESIYFSGIFIHKQHKLKRLEQLKGKTLALGNQYSTSSFNYPLVMLLEAGIQPERDLKKIGVMGAHESTIEKLANNEVFAAAASFQSWREAVNKGLIDPINFEPLIKSEPIPNPPLVISSILPKLLKEKIRQAFDNIHTWRDSETLLNSLRKIDRYDTTIDEQIYIRTASKLNRIDHTLKQRILTNN